MKTLLTLIAFFFAQVNVFAQLDTAKLNQLFNNYDTHQKAMLSMCLSENGKVVYGRSIGYANVESMTKANEHTLYHIGSITKMFTSVMIFQLIEEHKLTQETKLEAFFPSLPNSQKITISNLLNHRSGLHNFTDDSIYASYMEKPMTEKQLITIFEKQSADFEPDSKASYSNTNYVLLTFIIEKLTGHTYAEELQSRVCRKAGLSETRVAANIEKKNVAKSYDFENGQWKKSKETDMSVPLGAGAIISTPSDLCHFIEALFTGKLLSETSLNDIKTMKDNYGKGMFQFPFGTKKAYGHNGGIDGFESVLGYFPEERKAFCITGNGFNYVLNDVSIAVLSIWFDKPYMIPSFEKKALSQKESASFEGVYANSAVGMNITITKDGDQLMAQAKGQGAFPLDKVSELEYKFDAAGIKITFVKDEKGNIPSFKLLQSGMNLVFEKE
ncbi:D-alanyl-D-alanine carboxypeptidase [Filimonas sp.]|nr:D-alanyl-D-alanine carboxypeptidase [Filimonas sp.]